MQRQGSVIYGHSGLGGGSDIGETEWWPQRNSGYVSDQRHVKCSQSKNDVLSNMPQKLSTIS